MRIWLPLVALGTIAVALSLAHAADAPARIKTETVAYKVGDTECEGFVAYPVGPDGTPIKDRPGVVVVHEWTGLNDYSKSRAEQLAKLGYVAFAADIYGKGVRPADPKDAATTAGIYKKDRELLRKRVGAAVEQLRKQPGVDKDRVAAIGYCFGGLTVLELARSGADVKGVVSFHGDLSSLNADDAKKIKAKVLALHGAADPHVPPTQVAAFEEEMSKAKVDWELVK